MALKRNFNNLPISMQDIEKQKALHTMHKSIGHSQNFDGEFQVLSTHNA